MGWVACERVKLNRRRVCAWEGRVGALNDPTTLPFSATQAVVDAIWSEMGLRYPRSIISLPRMSGHRLRAPADRLSILLADQAPLWCLLRMLAHAMTSPADERSDGQGPLFAGIYVLLFAR